MVYARLIFTEMHETRNRIKHTQQESHINRNLRKTGISEWKSSRRSTGGDTDVAICEKQSLKLDNPKQ